MTTNISKTPFSIMTNIQRLTMKMEKNVWMYLEKVNSKNVMIYIEKTENGYKVAELDSERVFGVGKNFMQSLAIIYKEVVKLLANNESETPMKEVVTIQHVLKEALKEATQEKDSGKSWGIKDVGFNGCMVFVGLTYQEAKQKEDLNKGLMVFSYATSKALEYRQLLDLEVWESKK